MRHLERESSGKRAPPQAQSPPNAVIGETPIEGGMRAALDIVERCAYASLDTTSAGFLAYIPTGGLYSSAFADLVAGILNRYTGIALASAPLLQLEQDVIAWLAREFQLGPSACGTFTSGGSLATFCAIVSARDRAPHGGDLRRLTGYTSEQAHASVASAFRLAGIPSANLKHIRTDERLRLIPEELKAAIAHDRRAGLVPLAVVATAGTTNTGAIDPLGPIADICAEERLWFHVDAAYGGAFVLSEPGRARLEDIGRADSIAFDPHKGMFLPYGTGCLLLRRPPQGEEAVSEREAYLQDLIGEASPLSPADFGLELTRPFRGLRTWLPLMVHGAEAFRDALSAKLDLCARLYRGFRDMQDAGAPLDLVDEPQLTIAAWRLRRNPGESVNDWNARNAHFLRSLNERGHCIISSTLLPTPEGPVYTLRACVLSHRTEWSNLEHLLDDVRGSLKTLGALPP